MDLAKFLKPFELRVWASLVITICSIYTVLFVGNRVKVADWLYWFVTTMFEQGDNRRRYMKCYWPMLMVVPWLPCMIVLRSLYGFSTYSDLTARATPGNLPSSKRDLVQKPNSGGVWLLSNHVSFQTLERIETFMANEDEGKVKEHKTLLDNIKVINVLEYDNDLYYSGVSEPALNMSDSKPVKCQVGRETKGFLEDRKDICETTERFTYIYMDKPLYRPNLSLHLLLTIFSDKIIYKPVHEPSLVSNVKLWYTNGKYFYSDLLGRKLSDLVECGFQAYLEQLDIVIKSLKGLRYYKFLISLGDESNAANLTTPNPYSFYGFVQQYYEKDYKMELVQGAALNRKRLEETSVARLHEFRLIFVTHIGLSVGGILILWFERKVCSS